MSASETTGAAAGELVASEPRVLEPRPAGQVAVQAAAVAATSFVAGTAVAAIVRGRRGRAARRSGRRKDVNVVATRSFLVDVHLIDPRK